MKISAFEEYLRSTNYSPCTIKAYMEGISHYSRFYTDTDMESLLAYKTYCLAHFKPQTTNLRLHAINTYNKWAGRSERISKVHIQEPIFSDHPLSLTDYRKLMAALRTDYPDWYIFLKVLSCTGVRLGESRQITFSDLKKTNKVILGKGTKTRVIWFPLSLRTDLKQMIDGREGAIMSFPDGYIRSRLSSFRKKYKIKGTMSPHEFRRFYARQIYAKTKDVHLVKDLLGHASLQTTMRYLKVSAQSVARRISRIVDW